MLCQATIIKALGQYINLTHILYLLPSTVKKLSIKKYLKDCISSKNFRASSELNFDSMDSEQKDTF